VNDALRYFLRGLLAIWLGIWLVPTCLWAQANAPLLSGHVLDPSGAAVPALSVTLTGPGGASLVAQTDDQGRFSFRNLPAGTYRLEVKLKGFSDFVQQGIAIAPGHPQVVDVHLQVALEKQEVTVTDETTKVSVAPSENASSLVIKGKDIESLSDDPDELESELTALAGPSAGPNGGQIYIDGFTGGQLPPKSSIREIRVNQNPFSAQYDTLGYGRIEVLTKPGTDKLHGQFFVSGNDSAFNTRNPFATDVPGYHTLLFDGNLGGALGKKASFFLDGQRRNIQDDAVVTATLLSTDLASQQPYSQLVSTPETRTNFSPRFDTQFGKNNTLSIRYQIWKDDEDGQGVGAFSLPSSAFTSRETDQSIQLSDSQVLSEKAVTEIRFRYRRSSSRDLPQSIETPSLGAFTPSTCVQERTVCVAPTLAVQGAFTGGGNSSGTSIDTQDYYEAQNYTSVALSKHFLKFGARLRDEIDSSSVMSNFNGTFTFPTLAAYQITQQGLAAGLTAAEIRAAGGGASQFKVVDGISSLHVAYLDFEPYVEDDWKVLPNLNVSFGLRFETQNHIHDKADFAPRLGLAWGLGRGKSSKTVLRAGGGIFYDRFQESNILNAVALNGVNQLQYIVDSPDFYPNIPAIGTISQLAVAPTIYQIAANLRTPYTSQAGVGLEHQIAKNATVSVTYLNTHGVHAYLSRNINAPLSCPADDASCTPATAPRPLGGATDLYQYESAGLYNQNQVITNFNIRGSKVSMFGFYTLNYARSNANGAGSFPMNQYELAEDYGRAPWDVRHRVFLGGSWNLPRGFQLFPFMMANSSRPFNITVGDDLNGDGIYNDRPAFATDLSRSSVIVTRWGAFDTDPIAGQKIIPHYYGDGFGQVTVNLRLSKTFGFGKEVGRAGGFGGGGGGRGYGRGLGGQGLSSGGGGGMFNAGNTTNRRYNLTFSISARNLFNNVNLATPVGDLNSSYFGQATNITGFFGGGSGGAANRRIDLQVRFAF